MHKLAGHQLLVPWLVVDNSRVGTGVENHPGIDRSGSQDAEDDVVCHFLFSVAHSCIRKSVSYGLFGRNRGALERRNLIGSLYGSGPLEHIVRFHQRGVWNQRPELVYGLRRQKRHVDADPPAGRTVLAEHFGHHAQGCLLTDSVGPSLLHDPDILDPGISVHYPVVDSIHDDGRILAPADDDTREHFLNSQLM